MFAILSRPVVIDGLFQVTRIHQGTGERNDRLFHERLAGALSNRRCVVEEEGEQVTSRAVLSRGAALPSQLTFSFEIDANKSSTEIEFGAFPETR